MRVLVIGRSRRRDIEASIYRALRRAGHRAAIVDERRALHTFGLGVSSRWVHARAALFRPDHVILGKPIGVRPEDIRRISERAQTVMWYRDLRIPPARAILERARQAHTVFLTAGGQAPLFEEAGAPRALFLPDGVDPELDAPAAPHPDFACDIAFLGGADQHRAQLLERLAMRWNVRTWGKGWARWGARVGWTGRTAHYDDFRLVCASAKIVLGMERVFFASDPVWGYTSNRLWRVLAARGFYLGAAAPGLGEILRDGEHCAYYDDVDHAEAQVARYLAKDAERDRIRHAGHDFVLAHHTLDHRLHNLLTGAPFENPLTRAGA